MFKPQQGVAVLLTFIVMMVAMVPFISSSSEGTSDTPTMTISETSARAGSCTDVNFYISEVTLSAFKFVITYDEDLEAYAVESGISSGYFNYSCSKGVTTVTWFSAADTVIKGTIFSISFNLGGEAEGTYGISASCDSGNTFSQTVDEVYVECTDGSVSIAEMTGTPEIYAGSVSVHPGDTAEMEFCMHDASLSAFKFRIWYDDVFDVSKVESCLIKGSFEYKVCDEYVDVLWFNSTNVDMNGQVFTVTFEAGEDAGTYEIFIECDQENTFRMDSGNMADVELAVSNGTVKIGSDSPVDVPVTGVSLDATYLAMTVGNSKGLNATVSPSDATDKTVSWTSSDPAVATVSNGMVSAVSAGTAVIKATTEDGGYTVTCTVVVGSVNVPVTGISLDIKSLNMNAGDSKAITASVSPTGASDKTVSWSSSDTSVATVSNGIVSAVSAGNAVIKATTADGGYTATCSVKVSSSAIGVTGISLSSYSMALNTGGVSALTATVSPDNATDKTVTWSSSNTSVATVSQDGKVIGVSAGSCSITASSGNAVAKCVLTVVKISDEDVTLPASEDDGECEVTIPKEMMDEMKSGLNVTSSVGSIQFSKEAVSTLAGMNGDVSVSVEEVDLSLLNASQRETVGDGIVISLSAIVGGTSVHQLGGKVIVTIPYDLKGEDPDNVKVYYMSDSGSIVAIDCAYDETTGTVSFETDHFSYYAVTYEEPESAVHSDGVSSVVILGIIVVVILALAGCAYVIMKKRRAA